MEGFCREQLQALSATLLVFLDPLLVLLPLRNREKYRRFSIGGSESLWHFLKSTPLFKLSNLSA